MRGDSAATQTVPSTSFNIANMATACALAAMLFVVMSFQPAAALLRIAQDDSATPLVFASPRATTWSGLRSNPRTAPLFARVFARSD